jgi:tRNA(Ile)-lysidine synthase
MNPTEFRQRVDAFCKTYNLIPDQAMIIVGLSGGPDSMALLHYLSELRESKKITLIAVHLDHEWRHYSRNDVEFCRHQTESLNIEYIPAKASELNFKPKFSGSKEDLGRTLRRYFFEKVKKEKNADLIALAHQQQDHQETFFLRLIRGASLSGLTGMRPRHGYYIRPLLGTSRTDIIAYLDALHVPYLIDPSNESDTYLRNRIRNHVLPALRSADNRFEQNFERTLQHLKDADDFLDKLAEQTLATISSFVDRTLILDTKKFAQLDPVLQKRIIITWLIREHVRFTPTDRFINEIIKFMLIPTGKTHRIHQSWAIAKYKGLAQIHHTKLC